MATIEKVGQHPASSPDSVDIRRHGYVARQMGRTNGRVTPTQSDATEGNDSGVIRYPLVARLEALEMKTLLVRIEGLEARAAGAPGSADSPRVSEASSSKLRTADSFRNRSHDDISQLRLQVADLTTQVAEFEEQVEGRGHGGRQWRFCPRRGH